MKSIIKLINFFYKVKFTFYIPSSKNILIFDSKGLETISPFIEKKNFNVINARGEELNIYILIKLLLTFKKISYNNYLINYITSVNPKYIIHHSINRKFFLLKKNFPEKITIYIQSEFLNKTEIKFIKKNGLCDYAFLWGKQDVINFKSISKNNPELIGSILNNKFSYTNKKKLDSILFISQFRENKKNRFILNNGKSVNYNLFFKCDIFILKILFDYCNNKNFKLSILLSSKKNTLIEKEKEFYLKHLKSDDISFLSSINKNFGYQNTLKFKKIFFINSTLGFECLAKHKSCFFFSIRNKFLNFNYTNLPIPDNGPCWTSSLNKNKISKRIDQFISNETKEDRKYNYEKYFSKIIAYDKKNKNFKKKINLILSKNY